MHSSSVLLPLNVAVIPAAYLYGAGFSFHGIRETLQQWRGQFALKTGNVPDASNYVCEHPNMRPKFLAFDPIMVYIEGFLTDFEADYLAQLASPLYEESEVRRYNDDGTKIVDVDASHRRSETAWLPSVDPVVACVRGRAAEFEGYAPNATLDALAAVRYQPGGRFGMHHDWDTERRREFDRRTSFFATLACDGAGGTCEGGSTYFPFVRPTWGNAARFGRPWCRWVDCGYDEGGAGGEGAGQGAGVAVRPIKGNALFWVNFREDGTGVDETVHEGAPLLEGTKIGMNIWTWARIGAENGGIQDE